MSDDTPPPQEPTEGAVPPSTPGSEVPPSPPPASPYAGGAGSMPPPVYGAPPAGVGGYSPVNAIQYGWAKFIKSPPTLLVPALLVLVVNIVISGIIYYLLQKTLLGTHDCTKTAFGVTIDDAQCGPGLAMTLLGAAVSSAVSTFLTSLFGAGLIKSALNVVDDREVNVGDVFGYATKPAVVTTAAMLAVLSFVGTLLCYLPAIVISFLTVFTMFFVVDKGLAGVDAIKASVSLVTSKLGETILFYLLAAVVLIVGAIVCGIGLLVAVPVVLGGAAYTFRVLNSEPVSPAP